MDGFRKGRKLEVSFIETVPWYNIAGWTTFGFSHPWASLAASLRLITTISSTNYWSFCQRIAVIAVGSLVTSRYETFPKIILWLENFNMCLLSNSVLKHRRFWATDVNRKFRFLLLASFLDPQRLRGLVFNHQRRVSNVKFPREERKNLQNNWKLAIQKTHTPWKNNQSLRVYSLPN